MVDYTGGGFRGHYPAHHCYCDIVQGQYLLSILVFLLVHGPGEGGLRTGTLEGWGGGDKKSWTEVVLIVKSRDLCQPLMVLLLITNLDL